MRNAAADFNKGTGPENGAGESRGIGRTSGESIAAECDKAAGTGQGADRLIITGEIEQAAIDGDVAVGWQTSARAKLQCTRQNRRAAGVILGCREDGRASADLRDRAGAGNAFGESEDVGTIDGERCVVVMLPVSDPVVGPVAELQRAGVDRRPAAVTVRSGQDGVPEPIWSANRRLRFAAQRVRAKVVDIRDRAINHTAGDGTVAVPLPS